MKPYIVIPLTLAFGAAIFVIGMAIIGSRPNANQHTLLTCAIIEQRADNFTLICIR
jgi:hypothetical protein